MQYRCDLFKHGIANNALIDLSYSGVKFTWIRGNSLETRSRPIFDQALYNTSWRMRLPEVLVRHLPTNHSDHSPILGDVLGCFFISLNLNLLGSWWLDYYMMNLINSFRLVGIRPNLLCLFKKKIC